MRGKRKSQKNNSSSQLLPLRKQIFLSLGNYIKIFHINIMMALYFKVEIWVFQSKSIDIPFECLMKQVKYVKDYASYHK